MPSLCSKSLRAETALGHTLLTTDCAQSTWQGQVSKQGPAASRAAAGRVASPLPHAPAALQGTLAVLGCEQQLPLGLVSLSCLLAAALAACQAGKQAGGLL